MSALAWLALVPLLIAMAGQWRRPHWLVVWLAGWAFGLVGFFWLRHVTWVGTALLALYLSVYFVAFVAAIRWLAWGRGVPLALAAPLVWTALEWVRGVALTGFPWLFLGHTQYENLRVIQIADLTGATGVSFWIVAVNGALADTVCSVLRLRPTGRRVRTLVAGAGVLALTIAAASYGAYRLHTVAVREGPDVAVVQGNIPQDVKNLLTTESVTEILDTYLSMTEAAVATSRLPTLVIWPETMAPRGLFTPEHADWLRARSARYETKGRVEDAREVRAALDRNERGRRTLRGLQRRTGLLIGAGHYERADSGMKSFNSVFLLPQGGQGPEAGYDKIHLVPFGEYVPLRWLIGWIVAPAIPYERGLDAGDRRVLFEVDGWRLAPTVCFEDGFPSLVASFARDGRVDVIVNVTNEGWFRDGTELDQHLAIAVFRAVECRAGFVRAANTGISAIISPAGQITSKLVVDGSDREVAGVLRGHVPVTTARSPYLVVGEWLGPTCLVATLALVLAVRRRGRGKRASHA